MLVWLAQVYVRAVSGGRTQIWNMAQHWLLHHLHTDKVPGYMDCLIKKDNKIRLCHWNFKRDGAFKLNRSWYPETKAVTEIYQSEDKTKPSKLTTSPISLQLASTQFQSRAMVWHTDKRVWILCHIILMMPEIFPETLLIFNQLKRLMAW
jgi:hypothetical protein